MTLARTLTPDGFVLAREFLASVRADPTADALPVDELLFGGRYSAALPRAPDVERIAITTRRDAAVYLGPRLEPIQREIADHAGFWSWLGMYYFAETAPRDRHGVLKLSSLDETFIVPVQEDRSYQRRYRHYLWSAWRLQQAHGASADFLLDERINSFGDIADRVFSYSRIFNANGIVQLILRLYTVDGRQKPRFGRAPGGLRHLIRVLDQLERTYDVYGMPAEALMRILPREFDPWRPEAV